MTKPGREVPKAAAVRFEPWNDWVAVLRMPLMPPDLKKNCVPYCNASLRSTSAMVASICTSSGSRSILRTMAARVSSSCWVA